MDIVPYVAAAQEFVISHPFADTVAGFIAGGLAANPITCADLTFRVVDKIPPLRYIIKSNWPEINLFIDRFQEKFGADVSAPDKPVEGPKDLGLLPPKA